MRFLVSFLPKKPIDWETLAKTANIQALPIDDPARTKIINEHFPQKKDDDGFLLIGCFFLFCAVNERMFAQSKARPDEALYIERFLEIINKRIINHDFSCSLILRTDPQYSKSIQKSNFSYEFTQKYSIRGITGKCHFDVAFDPDQLALMSLMTRS